MTTRPTLIDPSATVDDFVSKSTELLHDYTFPTREVGTVIAILREAHATGQLIINFSQGGVSSVRFHHKEKITPP